MLNDVVNSENFGNAKIHNFDNVLFDAIENNVLKFEVSVNDTFSVTMTEQVEELMHDIGGSFFADCCLPFKHGGKRLSIAQFHDDEISMVVFEQLVDFVGVGMIDEFEFIDLLFKGLPFFRPHLELIDDVNRADEFGFHMDGFP